MCLHVCECGIYDTYDHMHIIYIYMLWTTYICMYIMTYIYISYYTILYVIYIIYIYIYILYYFILYMYICIVVPHGAPWSHTAARKTCGKRFRGPMGSRASEVRSHPKSRQIDKRKYAYGMHWSKQIWKFFLFEILFCMFRIVYQTMWNIIVCCRCNGLSFDVPITSRWELLGELKRSLQTFASDGLETCSAQFVAFKWKQGSGGMAYRKQAPYMAD